MRDIGNNVYLLLTPSYASMGDQAITYAEIKYIEKYYATYKLIILNEQETIDGIQRIATQSDIEDIFFIQGGGNMGELYPEIEERRRYVLSFLKNRKVTIFPQSIYYEKNAWKKSVQYYSNPNFTIYAREVYSYEFMKRYYPEANIRLKPDMVYGLANKIPSNKYERNEVLISLRMDRECCDLQFNRELIKTIRNKYTNTVDVIMFEKDIVVTNENREEYVLGAIERFKKASIVITDRLHGGIFSAISNTQCVFLSNNYHKIRGNYEWLKKSCNFKYINECDEKAVLVAVNELMSMSKDCVFDLDELTW